MPVKLLYATVSILWYGLANKKPDQVQKNDNTINITTDNPLELDDTNKETMQYNLVI